MSPLEHDTLKPRIRVKRKGKKKAPYRVLFDMKEV